MSLKERVYDQLTGHAGVAALVGTRVYRKALPQRPTLPALTYLIVITIPMYSHGGDTKFDSVRVQVSCWAETDGGADALAAQVRLAMNGWKAAHGDPAFLENDVDMTVPETGVHQRVLDWIIQHGG